MAKKLFSPVKSLKTESGQATVEFALTLPFLVLFSMCIVQLGSVANDQLALNHAAQTAARAISLADITDATAQEFAIATVNDEISLNDVIVEVELGEEIARVQLSFHRRINLPVIGVFLQEIELHASAVMPRQLTTS